MTANIDGAETGDGVASTVKRTTTEIVPVSVPLDVEREARIRADRLDEALEDVLADHVHVVPDWCFSPREDEPDGNARRVALHTTVEPRLANLVDECSGGDSREWIREAVREKVRREVNGGWEG